MEVYAVTLITMILLKDIKENIDYDYSEKSPEILSRLSKMYMVQN